MFLKDSKIAFSLFGKEVIDDPELFFGLFDLQVMTRFFGHYKLCLRAMVFKFYGHPSLPTIC
jgi:hypothetical protein